MNEIELVDRILGFAAARDIGDDCAIFKPPRGRDLLLTIDSVIEDVHFLRETPAAAVGHRALARGLSDIAAMGGQPHVFLIALTLAPWTNSRWLAMFYRGMLKLGDRRQTQLAGGDLSQAAKVSCSVTVVGSVREGKALRRDGARAGDAIYVSGALGLSWNQNLYPEPRVELGRRLLGRATAAMDLSDGLSIDLFRLARASGLAARIDLVPVAKGATVESALHQGEAYELLFTLPPRARPPEGSFRIGEIVRGTPGSLTFEGRPLPIRGYDHFRK